MKKAKSRKAIDTADNAESQAKPEKDVDALIRKAEEQLEEEFSENPQGHVGVREYFRAPNPILYMPNSHIVETLKQDAELKAHISASLIEIEHAKERWNKDSQEIERLKLETRAIIMKILASR